jgi:hypothetical protein
MELLVQVGRAVQARDTPDKAPQKRRATFENGIAACIGCIGGDYRSS